MDKFDSILKKSREIKDFKSYDVDAEWNHFEDVLKKETTTLDIVKSTNKNQSLYKYISAIAALLLLVVAFILFLKPDPKTRETITAIHKDSLVRLIDGSMVNVLKSSSIDYPLTLSESNERKIILWGNADFSVSKNVLPFRVSFNDFLVEVLGTKFQLRNLDSIHTFSVSEGKVSVLHVPSNQSLILEKGDNYSFYDGIFKDLNEKKDSIINDNQETKPILKNSTSNKKLKKEEKIKGSVYKLDSVIKRYFKKFYKNKITIDKKFKYNKDERVKLDLNRPIKDVLNSLQNQGIISFKKGDCEDCYIISSPNLK